MNNPESVVNKLLKKIFFWLSKDWLVLVFFVLSVILPLLWLRTNFLYSPEETLFANYQMIFDKFIYSWGDKLNYGLMAAPDTYSLLMPNAVFYKLFAVLGFSNHIIQILYLQVFCFFIFLSISYLLKIFTSSKKIILLGSLVYFFNFYVLQIFAYSAKMSQMILAPLFFYWLYKYLVTKKYKYAVFNFLGLFLLQNIFTNLPQAVATLAAYFLAILYFIIINKYSLKRFLVDYFFKIISFFALLLPILLVHALVYYFSMIQNMASLKNFFNFSALTSPLHLIFQSRGAWWEYAGVNGVPYSHWLPFYDNWLIIFISFFLFLFALMPIFRKKNLEKKYLFWLIIFLIAVFFASGSIFAPKLFLTVYNHIPFFYIFREPWSKFMSFVILSISVLTVLSFNKINNKKIFYFFLFLIFIRSLNFFSPNFFDHSNAKWKKIFIKPPTYWSEYADWTRNNKNKYVLSNPFYIKGITLAYNWYTQDLGNFSRSTNFVFDNSNAVRESQNFAIISQFNDIASSFDKIGSLGFIKLGTVDYLLEQKDITVSDKTVGVSEGNLIGKYFYTTAERSFGDKLILYKIKPEFYIPHVYVPKTVVTLDCSLDDVARIVSSKDYDTFTSLFIKSQNLSKINQLNKINKFKKDEEFSLEFEKINPTKYAVNIHNAKGIFPLLFLDNFNINWKLYLVNEKNNILDNNIWDSWFAGKISGGESKFSFFVFNDNAVQFSDESHLMVNGYANSWIVDTDEICGIKDKNNKNNQFCIKNIDGSYDFQVVIEYWPQRLFYVGLFISGTTLLGCLVYLGWDFVKRRKENRNRKI
jgi:hypothetical protein